MDTSCFSPAVRGLLSEDRLFPLDCGNPNGEVRVRLEQLTVESLFLPETVTHKTFGQACLAGLWLYHDFLGESHHISEKMQSTEGDYWHALMHLRERNYPDASYWLRKVGDHPIFGLLGPEAVDLAVACHGHIVVPSPWRPSWFIDYYQACANQKEPGELLARHIQQREWELLFGYCYQHAVAHSAGRGIR